VNQFKNAATQNVTLHTEVVTISCNCQPEIF